MRVVCRWGAAWVKGGHTCFVSPGSLTGRDMSAVCILGAAPGRHTDELMKRYAVPLTGVGAGRVRGEGILAINHPGWI